jgi:hypothetical protein
MSWRGVVHSRCCVHQSSKPPLHLVHIAPAPPDSGGGVAFHEEAHRLRTQQSWGDGRQDSGEPPILACGLQLRVAVERLREEAGNYR